MPVPTPPRRAQHQHAVAALHRVVRDEHAVRGAIGDRQRRRIGKGNRTRHGEKLVGIDETIFRHAAVEHLAHQPLALVERIDEDAVAVARTR